jgi:cyanophycinase
MRRALLMLTAVALAFTGESLDAKVTRYLTGNAADVAPTLSGPAHDFGGGSTDVDEAIQWMIDEVRGCTDCAATVDVVVLRSTGADGYNDYIFAMNGVDSVETLVVTSAKDANTAAVADTVRRGEVIFFAGGDQCDYVLNFKGTAVETAVEEVYARGGGVGGTSAGFAIQGEFVYDACSGSVTSAEALANPYHRSATFTYGFFNWAHLSDTITDQHFQQRDRMGRTLAFLARQIQDGQATTALAIAVNERTSLEVDADGRATVVGEGPAYFVLADHAPEVCQPKTPLTYSNFKIWRVETGDTFNLRKRPSSGYYTISVTDGVLSGDPY